MYAGPLPLSLTLSHHLPLTAELSPGRRLLFAAEAETGKRILTTLGGALARSLSRLLLRLTAPKDGAHNTGIKNLNYVHRIAVSDSNPVRQNRQITLRQIDRSRVHRLALRRRRHDTRLGALSQRRDNCSRNL